MFNRFNSFAVVLVGSSFSYSNAAIFSSGYNSGDGYVLVSYVTNNFTFSPSGVQQFVVPEDVYSLNVTVSGAAGGNAFKTNAVAGAGGYGAVVTTTLAVTPKQVLYFVIGGRGGSAFDTHIGGTAGYNGGGLGNGANYAAGGGGMAHEILSLECL